MAESTHSQASWLFGVIVGCIATLLILVAGVFTLIAYKSGYTLAAMDWNSDGFTTPSEILASSEIGSRKSGNCIEYFSYKDGLTVKSTCPGPHT
jgi:hypothetical protein